MKIFIVGSGKLANALLSSYSSFPYGEITRWATEYQTLDEKAIIVHAGSGRQLHECLDFCRRTSSVFIELSTGLETEKLNPDFPLIVCPNTSILLIKTLWMLKKYGSHFEKYSISITESHQSTKTTEPGTAYSFADSLKLPHHNVRSVRDPQIQERDLGIPNAYLDRHAYHKISIKDQGDEVTIETKVLGHTSYAHGVHTILASILPIHLENKRYTVLDLIENGIL